MLAEIHPDRRCLARNAALPDQGATTFSMPWRTSGLSPGALSAAPSLRSVSSPAVSLPKTVYLLSRLGSVPARGEKSGRHALSRGAEGR